MSAGRVLEAGHHGFSAQASIFNAERAFVETPPSHLAVSREKQAMALYLFPQLSMKKEEEAAKRTLDTYLYAKSMQV